MNLKRRVVVVSAGAFAALTGAWFLLVRPSGVPGGDEANSLASAEGPAISPPSLDGASIERIAELASRAVSSHHSALQNSVADALTVYSSGTTDDWLAYLQAYGIDPPQTAETMPALMDAGWRRTRAFFSDARFDVSGTETMLNPRDPQPQERFPEAELGPEDAGKFLMTARRDAARAFLQTTQFDERERVRVTIPGSFQSVDIDGQLDAERFQAAVSIEFTLNPETGQWVLTELRVEGKTEAEDGRTPGVGMML